MEPFRVKCMKDGEHGVFSLKRLVLRQNYTVVEIDTGLYRLAEMGTELWSPERFVKVDKDMEYWHALFRWEEEQKRAALSPKDAAQADGQPYHLVMEGIHDLNTATNLVAALTKKFGVCHFDIQNYYRAESGTEYIVVENPPSVSSTRRKRIKTFCEGFLAALP
jgi:hypothetical protein